MAGTLSRSDWIAFVFDHPVCEPAWYWKPDAPDLPDTPERTITFMSETFERSNELLSRFSDGQLEQAFGYLIGNYCHNHIAALTEPAIPISCRIRALRSFVPLFEQTMAIRCSPHLSHLDEQSASPLNGSCYMWWDILPILGDPLNPDRREFDAEVLRVLSRLLAVPHDACRESALHGLAHWEPYYRQVADIIDNWLARTPNLRPELIAYAKRARVGNVQ